MKQKPVPYIYQIEKSAKLMIYYGADHSFDPKHRQWDDIRDHFKEFIEKTKGLESIVLVEGGGNQLRDSEHQAIIEGGEPLFMTFLAHQAKIPVFSPEPDELYEINELLKIFNKSEILHYYFSRLVHQWHRYAESRPDFESYMNKFLKHYKEITGWKDFSFTINHLKDIHLQLTGKTFEDTDEEEIYHMIWPTEKFNWICNRVSLESTKIRNNFIQSEVKRCWDEGKNIFIIFGQGHAVENEDFLRENLN